MTESGVHARRQQRVVRGVDRVAVRVDHVARCQGRVRQRAGGHHGQGTRLGQVTLAPVRRGRGGRTRTGCTRGRGSWYFGQCIAQFLPEHLLAPLKASVASCLQPNTNVRVQILASDGANENEYKLVTSTRT